MLPLDMSAMTLLPAGGSLVSIFAVISNTAQRNQGKRLVEGLEVPLLYTLKKSSFAFIFNFF